MGRVRALYDFEGEANTSEISISVGEILNVSRMDVGEGWWEGTNSRGLTGLFPAAYVEVLSEPDTVAAPPNTVTTPIASQQLSQPLAPHAAAVAAPTSGVRYDQTSDEWNEHPDEWEDDWDDDRETYSEIGPPTTGGNGGGVGGQNSYNSRGSGNQTQSSLYSNAALPPTPSDDTISIASSSAVAVRKPGKIFSKAGDSYIMGTNHIAVSENERSYILQTEVGYVWNHVRDSYNVMVAAPKKETKFKGMKSFIAYQLTPSFNNSPVSRRYKHFDWLHERLVAKFSLIPIPPLPDKQISGRYEEQFVEHRRVQLQEFVNWMCRHPILSLCDVWMHFLLCTDEKKWKMGKRTAEKDPLVGATYCAAIFPPEKQLLQSQVDAQIELYNSFVHTMDGAVKSLFAICNEQTKKCQIQWKKDFQRVGEGLSELAKSLEIDERRAPSSVCLSNAVGQAAGVYIAIGQIFGDQPKNDWIPFADRLHIYRGILGTFPDILSEHRGAMQKRKECERLTAEQKMGNAQLQEVNRRTDIMSYAVLAEFSHFRTERDDHLKSTLRHFIGEQIEFYQNIVSRLQVAQHFFD